VRLIQFLLEQQKKRSSGENKENPLLDYTNKETTALLLDDRYANTFVKENISIDPGALSILIRSYNELLRNIVNQSLGEDSTPIGYKLDEENNKKTQAFFNIVLMHACAEVLDEKGNLDDRIVKAYQFRSIPNYEENKNSIKNALVKAMASYIIMLIVDSKEHKNEMTQLELLKKIRDLDTKKYLITRSLNNQKKDEKNLEKILEKYIDLCGHIRKNHHWFSKTICDYDFYTDKETAKYFSEKLNNMLFYIKNKCRYGIDQAVIKDLKDRFSQLDKKLNTEEERQTKEKYQTIKKTYLISSHPRMFCTKNPEKNISFSKDDLIVMGLISDMQYLTVEEPPLLKKRTR